MATKTKNANGNGGQLGFEATLWAAADKLRVHMLASYSRSHHAHAL
ncbi:MAG: hypothetical protein NTY01_10830 [Verrucomicrobia bacterium]|nr:hypothetical protein [Verrucomicrobiota bacterium]